MMNLPPIFQQPPAHNKDGTLVAPFERWDPVLACAQLPFVAKVLDGEKIQFSRWGDLTLGRFKRDVGRVLCTPVPSIAVIYKGRQLKRSRAQLVRDYGVVPGENCWVVVRRNKMARRKRRGAGKAKRESAAPYIEPWL